MAIGSNIHEIESDIRVLKKTAIQLQKTGADFPAVSKNINRVLASIKMLEINISDIVVLSKNGQRTP